MTARERIIESAFGLFSENPYKNVTIEEIARVANVAKGTVIYHFKSKYKLAIEALINGTLKIDKEIRNNLIKEKDDKKILETLIVDILKTYGKYPKINRFTMELYELSSDNKRFFKMISKYYDETIRLLSGLLEKNGVPNPKLRAQLLRSCLDGLILHQEFFADVKESFDLLKISQELLKLIMA